MNKLIKVAVDAMGGDNAPQKIIDGIELHHKKTKLYHSKTRVNVKAISRHPVHVVYFKHPVHK